MSNPFYGTAAWEEEYTDSGHKVRRVKGEQLKNNLGIHYSIGGWGSSPGWKNNNVRLEPKDKGKWLYINKDQKDKLEFGAYWLGPPLDYYTENGRTVAVLGPIARDLPRDGLLKYEEAFMVRRSAAGPKTVQWMQADLNPTDMVFLAKHNRDIEIDNDPEATEYANSMYTKTIKDIEI